MEFDLFTEPWLPVVQHDDGALTKVGIFEALVHAGRYRRLVAEAPPVTAALHRLLLAVAHRAYGPADTEAWQRLWCSESGLPEDELGEYGTKWAGRFDLFHPDHPFLQCRSLAIRKGAGTDGEDIDRDFNGVAELVSYRSTGSNATLFDHTPATRRIEIPADEAARWLVTLMAYDPGGTKTPVSKERKSERGPANYFGCTLVEGANLHQTLTLNLVPYAVGRAPTAMTTAKDSPLWERDEPSSLEPLPRDPEGWTDLLTWPSRHALLRARDTDAGPMVYEIVRTPGATLDKKKLPLYELMAAYRASKPGRRSWQDLKPVKLEPLLGVWRHAVELLLRDNDGDRPTTATRTAQRSGRATPGVGEVFARRRPAALTHIADSVARELIPDHTVYTLRVFGQQLGKMAATVDAWKEESVPVPVALLRAHDEDLGELIGGAVQLADSLGRALHLLQLEYRSSFAPPKRKGERRPEEKARLSLEILYWPRLDAPFGDFLRDLGADLGDARRRRECCEQWLQTVLGLADRAAEQWMTAQLRRQRASVAAGAVHAAYGNRRRTALTTFRRAMDDWIDDADDEDGEAIG